MIMVYGVAAILLFLFSYTQVDLSLTLSQVSIFQTIEKVFQHIGFYLRPIASGWYVGLVVLFFVLYVVVLVKTPKLRTLWTIIFVITAILVFSYPAFSYDIFNYMFTAKTVLMYHKNPYAVIPLQFTGVEPWLSFMHWTHLPSAYTPLWIVFTLPAYILGFGKFLLILWNIKILVAGFYIMTCWYIGKILEKKDPATRALGIAIFALNPLVIFETLVSGHNDIVMMAIAVASLYYSSYFLMAIATAMKLMTIFLFPVMIFGYKPMWNLVAMGIGLILVLTQRDILPWYWVWIMPFIALLPRNKPLVILASAVSGGLLLRYAPFFYFGHWNAPVPTIEFWVTLVPPVLAGVFLLIKK